MGKYLKKKTFTIRQKVWITFVAIGMLFFLMVGTFYYYLTAINRSHDEFLQRRMVILRNTDHIQLQAIEQINKLQAFLISGNQNFIADMKKSNQQLAIVLQNTKSLVETKEEQNYIWKLQILNKNFLTVTEQVVKYRDDEASIQLIASFADMFNQFANNMKLQSQKLADLEQQLLEKQVAQNGRLFIQIVSILVLVFLFVVCLLLLIGWIVSKRMVEPVVMISQAARNISFGDLTVDSISIHNKDEIGELAQSFNMMKANLHQLIQEVKREAEQVVACSQQLTATAEQTKTATEQIAATMQEVSAGVNNQVETIEYTFRTVQEMAFSAQQIAERTHIVSSKSVEASEKSAEGRKMMETLVQQMTLMSQTVNELSNVVKELGIHSKEITHIMEVITELSEQTHLLALNATIEAARAGEHGRGFAVVANAVRKLAEQSAQSAQQVSLLVSKVQQETDNVIISMENVTDKVGTGIRLVHMADESFAHIYDTIRDASVQVQQVSSEITRIALGTEQIVQSMKHVQEITASAHVGAQEVSGTTEEQLASMQQVSAAAYTLSNMSEKLQMLIGKFKA